MSPHFANVVVHVAAGAGALALGVVVLLSHKGGSFHRRLGRVVVWLGGVALITAIVGVTLFNPPAALVAATVAFGYQYLSGLRALALRTRGPGVLDIVLALAGMAACVALYRFMGPGTESWTPALGYSAIGYTAMIVLYDLSRVFWAGAWLRHARNLDHGLKMTGAYFAMASAGIGNLLRDLQPWSQVGPSVAGLVVMLVLAGAFAAGLPGSGRAARSS